MSTQIVVKGIPRTINFRKLPDGGWEFPWGKDKGGNPLIFKAWRNSAGFEGRAWELHFWENGDWRVIDDMLASRTEAVESAIDWTRFH